MSEQSKGFFGEVITAMVTPMKKVSDAVCAVNFEVDYQAAAELAVSLINSGSDALVLSGTTGEAPTTHVEEKEMLIKIVRERLVDEFPGRHIPLIAGTGSNDTEHAIRNCQVAEDAGADAVLVVTPYYSRPSQAGILAHYQKVADSTNLPVILYDVPGRSGVKIDEATYVKLAHIPSVVAIKDATGNVYQAGKTLAKCNAERAELGLPEVTLYSGDDSLLLPFLSVGAKGIISVASHICGADFKDVITAFKANNMDQARSAFMRSVDAVDLLNGTGQQAACTKAALEALGMIPSRIMRLPNVALEGEELKRVVDGVKR